VSVAVLRQAVMDEGLYELTMPLASFDFGLLLVLLAMEHSRRTCPVSAQVRFVPHVVMGWRLCHQS